MKAQEIGSRQHAKFVIAQLRPEVALGAYRAGRYHLRTEGAREEIDVVELPGRKLLGIEVKASATPEASDARHLRWLQARSPERFVAGAVVHTGPDVIEFDEKILAVPICAFWG